MATLSILAKRWTGIKFEAVKFKLVLIFLCCSIFRKQAANSQPSANRLIIFKKEPKEKFSFVRHWDYAPTVIKDANGKFDKADEGDITPSDTAHLFFTADCKTNVQGGYMLRYCHLQKKGNNLRLSFSGGAPAYANEFNIYIAKGRFSFKPVIIYPEIIASQKINYKLSRNKLILYQKDYTVSKVINGYIDAEFVETVSTNKTITNRTIYYFRRYFKTGVRG